MWKPSQKAWAASVCCEDLQTCLNLCLWKVLIPVGTSGKETACQCRLDVRDVGSIPGSGSFLGGEYGNPLQLSCLENPINRGTWQTAVHKVAQSQSMKRLSTCTKRYWNHTESVLLSLWNYVTNQYRKIFENNSNFFKCNVTFTKRDLLLSCRKPQNS